MTFRDTLIQRNANYAGLMNAIISSSSNSNNDDDDDDFGGRCQKSSSAKRKAFGHRLRWRPERYVSNYTRAACQLRRRIVLNSL